MCIIGCLGGGCLVDEMGTNAFLSSKSGFLEGNPVKKKISYLVFVV